MLTVYTLKTRNCSTALLYTLAFTDLEYQIKYIDGEKDLPAPTKKAKFPKLPYIVDEDIPDEPIYGEYKCMCHIVNKAEKYILLPNDDQ